MAYFSTTDNRNGRISLQRENKQKTNKTEQTNNPAKQLQKAYTQTFKHGRK